MPATENGKKQTIQQAKPIITNFQHDFNRSNSTTRKWNVLNQATVQAVETNKTACI